MPDLVLSTGPLAGGIDDSALETRLGSGNPPPQPFRLHDAENVDFDRDSARSSPGSLKLNNQTAPKTGVRTRVDPGFSPLLAASSFLGGSTVGTCSVPLRGRIDIGYSLATDIGGKSDAEGDFLLGPQTFHNRRGRTFCIETSFQMPAEGKLYSAPTKGAGAPATPGVGFAPTNGFDEALDECCCIIQKGGEGLAPMSWALAVVNIGDGAGLSFVPANRPSNYALVFMWLDSAQFGEGSPAGMKYTLSSGESPVGGAHAQFSTQAYRAILFHQYLIPGSRYNIALNLSLDAGTPGSTISNTNWSHNGFLELWTGQDTDDLRFITATNTGVGTFTYTSSAVGQKLEVIRGPTDSIEYLCKYGVRFFGHDMMFVGLGMRSIPWQKCGFVPYGSDCTALEVGGFRMADRSNTTAAQLYGVGVYKLQATHTSGNAYVEVNATQGFATNNTSGGASPWGQDLGGGLFTRWDGLGAVGGVANCNPNALRGYRLVATAGFAAMPGGIMTCLDYSEVGASYRMNILDGATAAKFTTWLAQDVLVQCFRWHQRDLVHSDLRIYSVTRNYNDADTEKQTRRRMEMRQGLVLDDPLQLDVESLMLHLPMDDAEGGVVRDTVVGGARSGFFAPLGLGTVEGGRRGSKQVYLSGEGEAPCFDLSANPRWLREVGRLLAGRSKGFAMEITFTPMQAYYAIGELVNVVPETAAALVPGRRARFVPALLCWETKAVEGAGMRSYPRPILELTHGGTNWDSNIKPFFRPMGFYVGVGAYSDQEYPQPVYPADLQPFFLDGAGANVGRYDLNAGWVGQSVTIQIGVQSTGSPDQYDAYIAMTPKDAFNPANGDAAGIEFAYWTDGSQNAGAGYAAPYQFKVAHLRLPRYELARSVITLGRFAPHPDAASGVRGYTEMQPRMLVDEVRVFARPAPGALPTVSGQALSLRNGKIDNSDVLPQRQLVSDDLNLPVGPGRNRISVTDQSRVFAASDNGTLYNGDPKATLRAISGGLIRVTGEAAPIGDGALDEDQDQIMVVRAAGTFEGLFFGATRSGATAYHVPLAAYTAFEDDIRDSALTLGPGKGYGATSTAKDAILSSELWENVSPIVGGCVLRIYSPLSRIGLRDILPAWTRGLTQQRANPILGMFSRGLTKYAAARGSVFEVDDRWRMGGPRPDLKFALAFRAKRFPNGLLQPLESDRVDTFARNGREFVPSATDALAFYMDAWVNLDEVGAYQTIWWYGDPANDPSKNAGSGMAFHASVRFNRGRPELVIGSTAKYDGVNVPEKGLFVATATSPVTAGVDVHVRFVITTRTNGTILLKPWCFVNGYPMPLMLNAVQSGLAADEWMQYSKVVSSGLGGTLAIGASFDSYLSPEGTAPLADGADVIRPARIHGWMHSLCGRIYDMATYSIPVWAGSTTGTAPPSFNPLTWSYAQAGVIFATHIFDQGPGYGADLFDIQSIHIPIKSHPFISRYHELGGNDEPVTFANMLAQTFVTNGSKPARIQDDVAGPAGVLPPTTPPSATAVRFPIWRANNRPLITSQGLDPVVMAVPGAAQLVYHYDAHENNYWKQVPAGAGITESHWGKDANRIGFFGFKVLLRSRDITGRRTIVRRGSHRGEGGPFIEIDNGFVRAGWYDKALKKAVAVTTSLPVIREGEVCLIYLRKSWPQQDLLEGNWLNSYYSNGRIRRVRITLGGSPLWAIGDSFGNAAADVAGTQYGRVCKAGPLEVVGGVNKQTIEYVRLDDAGAEIVAAAVMFPRAGATGTTGTFDANPVRPTEDSLVVRILRDTPPSNTDHFSWEAKTGAVRNCVSFTCDKNTRGEFPAAGTGATGLVSIPGLTGTGAGAGVFNIDQPAYTAGLSLSMFHPDMIGMYLGFGAAAPLPFQSKTYRIVTNPGVAQVTVIDELTGTNPNLAGLVGVPFGVFSGVSLIKDDAFDLSAQPDDAPTDIYWFGDLDSAQDFSETLPFDGEWWSPGITFCEAFTALLLDDARVFELFDTSLDLAGAVRVNNDPILTGTDIFPFALQDGDLGAPGELHYDDWAAAPSRRGTWFSVDGRDYVGVGGGASTQPNVGLLVTRDTANPICSANAPDAVWQFIQALLASVGERVFRCAFFDEDQNQASDPGPEFVLRLPAEDRSNPSGAVRYVVGTLPFPRQAGNISVLVGVSVIGGDTTSIFQFAQVPAGTRDIGMMLTDAQIATLPPFLFTNGAPPRCFLVEAARGRMFYGAIEVQPDACLYSQEGLPGAIDYSSNFAFSLFRVVGGDGERITMLRELDGNIMAAKRRCVASATIAQNGIAEVMVLSQGVGCVGPLASVSIDGRLHMLDPRGWVALQRGIDSSVLAVPSFIGDYLRNFFTDGIDRRHDRFFCAALNRARGQVVLACRESGAQKNEVRVSTEYDMRQGGGPSDSLTATKYRFSRYRSPRVTVMATVQDLGGGSDRLLGGTEEGFAVWLDRPETDRVMLSIFNGDQADQIIAAGSTKTLVQIASIAGLPRFQIDLANVLGVPLVIQKPGGGVMRGVCARYVTTTSVLMLEPFEEIPTAGQPALFGTQQSFIETPWLDFGVPKMRKQINYVTLLAARQAYGKMQVDLYVDGDADHVIKSALVDLTLTGDRARQEAVFGSVSCRLLKMIIRPQAFMGPQAFDLAEVHVQYTMMET